MNSAQCCFWAAGTSSRVGGVRTWDGKPLGTNDYVTSADLHPGPLSLPPTLPPGKARGRYLRVGHWNPPWCRHHMAPHGQHLSKASTAVAMPALGAAEALQLADGTGRGRDDRSDPWPA